MTKLTYHPTPEQLAALVSYAREHGRTWKSSLNHDWSTGQSTGELQQVRNSFGPSWLVRFKLPEVPKCLYCGHDPLSAENSR